VKNITVANYSNIAGWLETNGDSIVWAVGNVTVNGITYTNLEVRYTISTQTWTHYTKPSQVLCASRYNDGTTLFQLVGDNNGTVLKVDTGNDDNGTPISYSLIHRWATLDGLLHTEKNIPNLLFTHEGGRGANATYQTEVTPKTDWSREIGQLGDFATIFTNTGISGRKFRPRISGFSSGEPFSYNGYEIFNSDSEFSNL
jgi:hypothetical protein